jgi:hypothetical protein
MHRDEERRPGQRQRLRTLHVQLEEVHRPAFAATAAASSANTTGWLQGKSE